MVLGAAYTLSTYVLPPKYYVHAAATTLAGVVTYAFAQGRTTNRERDLHARTVLVTGAFTPLGLTLITSLAARGAHIIALSDYPLEHSLPSLLVPVLRTTTSNEEIYAEYADLSSPESIRAFCTKFLTGEDHRLDAVIFAHEYRGIGSILKKTTSSHAEQREVGSLATFLLTTLLLPKLLVAPIERDIRIINVINPFYAASAPLFPKKLASLLTANSSQPRHTPEPLFLAEGYRALRTAIFTRHLQRVLNALPNGAPAPDASKSKTLQTPPPPPNRPKISNIIAVSAAPGISRAETISPLLGADRDAGSESFSVFGLIIYIFFYPLIWLFAKPSKAAQQSVLHVLFLPTPFKRALAQLSAAADPGSAPTSSSSDKAKEESWEDTLPEEVLKPGALYRECAVVKVNVPPLPPPPKDEEAEEKDKKKTKGKAKGSEKEEFVILEDDGELGGESLGRVVWEWYEMRLKDWEAREKAKKDKEKKDELKGSIPQQKASTSS